MLWRFFTWDGLVDKKAFTISEVAADWHDLMMPQRTMRKSIKQYDPRFAASRYTTALISHTKPLPVARMLLLIFRPT